MYVKVKVKKIIPVSLLLSLSLIISAQSLSIKGYLADASGKPYLYPELYYEIQIAELNRKTTLELFYDETVQEYIDTFLGPRKDQYLEFRDRSEFFFPLFEKYLTEFDIPDEIKYLSVLESGLRPEACSPSMALGLWQFKEKTGIHYGLTISGAQDERLSPELSTIAACRYLTTLYQIYNNWELSLLAYNTGPTTLDRAIIKNGGIRDYFSLHPHLSPSTKRYLPALVALIYLFENHETHF